MTAAGDTDVLKVAEINPPSIEKPTQIKVRLHAAGVNPIDTKIRSRGLFYNAEPPATLGCDGSGVVIETGEAVERFRVGDAVWFCHGGLGREPGNYAELTVIEADEAELKPIGTPHNIAAAGPLVLITAWEALFDRGGLQPGQDVLIHAGGGGVGHVAIQLAKIHGARVITTVGTRENAELVRRLGADIIINYRFSDVVDEVLDTTGGFGVDLALDTVGPDVFRQSIDALKPYGTLVTLLDPGKDIDFGCARAKNLRIAFTLMLTPMLQDLKTARRRQGEILRQCAQLIDDGRLQLHVSRHYPLQDAAQAHAQIETGHTQGKLVLDIT